MLIVNLIIGNNFFMLIFLRILNIIVLIIRNRSILFDKLVVLCIVVNFVLGLL